MNMGRRTLGPVSGGGAIPPGYVVETGTVELVNWSQFKVNRNAIYDYAVGRPLVLLAGGKLIHSCVSNVSYNTTDSKTYVTTTSQFTTLPVVYYDASLPYVPGVDRDTLLLMHFNTATLGLDSSFAQRNITTVGTPTAVTATPSPRFGAQCCGVNGSSAFVATTLPALFTTWTWEAWVYGQIATTLAGGCYDYSGANPQRYSIGIDGSFRLCSYQYCTSQSVADTFYSSAALAASQWNHVAMCRDGTNGKYYAFVNGVGGLIGTGNYSGYFGGSLHGILCSYDDYTGAKPLLATNGLKVDEIRISSIVRYLSNFTVQALPFGPDAQ